MTEAPADRSGGKWIFVAGAPGSRWSAVARSIFGSPDCDTTDIRPDRQYTRSSEDAPMHTGAYWDPGMEFGEGFDQLDRLSRSKCEAAFNAPFSGQGRRVVKSHTFCHHLAFLRNSWPDCPLVVVYRSDTDCLNWWLEAGGFDISYPNYNPYYRDKKTMASRIRKQNHDLLKFVDDVGLLLDVADSMELCSRLGIRTSSPNQDFAAIDVQVGVAS